MNQPSEIFKVITEKYCKFDSDVQVGKMMHSPGLKYRNHVFAFYYKESMGFRLGADFDPVKFGIINAKPLSPFKTKPPLKGWFVIDKAECAQWDFLTEISLEFTKTLK